MSFFPLSNLPKDSGFGQVERQLILGFTLLLANKCFYGNVVTNTHTWIVTNSYLSLSNELVFGSVLKIQFLRETNEQRVNKTMQHTLLIECSKEKLAGSLVLYFLDSSFGCRLWPQPRQSISSSKTSMAAWRGL